MNHTLRTCSREQSFFDALLKFWLWDIIPVCFVFLSGLTIYIPVISVSCSVFQGFVLALDVYAFFSNFSVFFAITMTFIRICAMWMFIWYLSYISSSSVKIYTSQMPFIHALNYVFVGKYIVWFTVFAFSALLLDAAQCLMYRI
ncbi:MAG: hypothetical protein E7588_00960 [Ruminococcaceae bacterium]|nr:hypothetical protein [Oscillospiraceae bacterium]